MDIVRAFSYAFEDDDWVSKLVLTAIISIIPIINFATFGWTVELIRNMLDGYEHPLPEWDNFGDKFTAGISYFLASVLYNLPLIIGACLIAIVGSMFSSGRSGEGVMAVLSCGYILVALAYAILANAVMFIGVIRYSRTRDFSSFTKFGENMSIARENLDVLIMLVLFSILAGLGLALFGWIPCIGWLLALALGAPIYGHLQGQAARQIVGKAKRGT